MKMVNAKFTCMFSILAFMQVHLISAQSTFVRMYNQGNMGYAVREINGNSYVAAGSTNFYFNWHWFISSPIASTNMHLFKTDVNGVMQWERIYTKLNARMIARWMEPTNDGGFIITGSINSDMVWPPDSNDIALVKTDANGFISWAKYFDTGKDELGFCVQQTSDNGYILSAFHDAMPVSLVGDYIVLIKTDASGLIQWEKKYQFAVRDLNTHEPLTYVVKQTSDGGFIVAGTIVSGHPADLAVLRTDASGNLAWAKSFDHDASMFRNSLGIDIIENTSGDFVIAGSMDKDSPLHINYPYFLKINNSGVVLKARFFETVPGLMFQSGFSSVEQTADGGYFFTGMGGYSDFGDQAQLLKTDSNLDMQWSRVYTVDGAATIGSMSGRQTSDGGFVFTGKRQMSGSILMKTDGLGQIPCKNPGSLIEFVPGISVLSWNPPVTSGINSVNMVLNTQSPLADTAILCPVIISHLPVELSHFSAQVLPENNVRIKWTTESELNNDYFIIERSVNSKTFNEIGRMPGFGNTNTTHAYAFTDHSPIPTGITYYRLCQVDKNGNTQYSKSAAIHLQSELHDSYSVFSDTENNLLKIYVPNCKNQIVSCMLTDALGKVILSKQYQLHDEDCAIGIGMQSSAKGIYFLKIANGEKISTAKVMY